MLDGSRAVTMLVGLEAPTMKKPTKRAASKSRPVVVCTEVRGVFFGYATDTTGETIKLAKARNAYYWKCSGGILELAAKGPQTGSKIGDRADIELRKISAVLECTPAAAKAWEAGTWA